MKSRNMLIVPLLSLPTSSGPGHWTFFGGAVGSMIFKDSDRRLGDKDVIRCWTTDFPWLWQVPLTQAHNAEHVDYLLTGHWMSKVGIQPSYPQLYTGDKMSLDAFRGI